MNRLIRNYSIHDIVEFRIISEKISKRLEIEYKNFESGDSDDPDFTIYLGKFKPGNDRTLVIDNTYNIKEGYIYCKDSYKYGSWKLEVSGLDAPGSIIKLSTNLIGSYAADMFICNYIIDFIIRFKLNLKGFSIVHASAVSNGDQAFLFPSQSGAGKTTTALYFAEDGYAFLGDDFVILHEGKVLSYLTPLNIFTYNLNPVVLKKLSSREKSTLNLKELIYKMTAKNIKIFTKVNPLDLFSDQVIDSSKLRKVFLLMPGDEFSIQKASQADVLNNLFLNLKLESFPFLKYLMEYTYVFPDSTIANFWSICWNNLAQNLHSSVNLYSMNVPRNYDRVAFKAIKEEVLCGI